MGPMPENESLEPVITPGVQELLDRVAGLESENTRQTQNLQERIAALEAENALLKTHQEFCKTYHGSPLDHSKILNLVLEHLPLTDVKNCRLVNKFWNLAAIPNFKALNADDPISLNENLVQFCEDMEATLEFPFSSFEVDLNQEEGDTYGPHDFLHFFSGLGTEVRELSIIGTESPPLTAVLDSQDELKAHQVLFHLLKHILSRVPNMEAIRLTDIHPYLTLNPLTFDDAKEINLSAVRCLKVISTGDIDNAAYSVEFVDSFLSLIPNLSRMFLHIDSVEIIDNFIGGLRLVKGIDSLEIDSVIHSASLERLVSQGQTLITVRLNQRILIDSLKDVQNFGKLLTLLSCTVESLAIKEAGCGSSEHRIEFPLMPKLRNLEFATAASWPNMSICFGIQSSQVPNLRSLTTSLWFMEQLLFGSGESYGKLEVLELLNPSAEVGEETSFDLQNIGIVFPNVRTLRLKHADAEMLELVFGKMTDIEELEIKYTDPNREINSVLCGFPENVFDSACYISFKKPELSLMHYFVGANPMPSLRCMKKLKKFTFEGRDQSQLMKRPYVSQMIKDVTVYAAFTAMHPMRIDLHSDSIMLSEIALGDLSENHSITLLSRTD